MPSLIPMPASLETSAGSFSLSEKTKICTPGTPETAALGGLLAEYIELHTHLNLAVENSEQVSGNIRLMLTEELSLGKEGYELTISADSVQLKAHCPG